MPAHPPGADVLQRELTLANPALLRQCRTRSLLAVAVARVWMVRIPNALPQARAKLGVSISRRLIFSNLLV